MNNPVKMRRLILSFGYSSLMPQRAPKQKFSPQNFPQVFSVFFGLLRLFHLPFPNPMGPSERLLAKRQSSPGDPVGKGKIPPFGLKIEYNPYFSRFSPPYNLLIGKKSPPCWTMIHSRKNSYFSYVSIPLGLGFSRRNIPFKVGKI